ncbi:MAG: transporter substrate-binding domain-containing protein [Synergistaceae bacterium]|nr:transporter substrate-binding domain-containing protein [Synergistaceae bacterium]
MYIKKFLCALIFVVLLAGCAYCESNKIGVLAKLNLTQEELSKLINDNKQSGIYQKFSSGLSTGDSSFIYYDSLMSLLMALNSGEVSEIQLPEDVADYVLNVNDAYRISSIIRMSRNFYLSFGFRASDNPELRNKFNDALLSMKADGTILILQEKYIADAGLDAPEPVKFAHYDNIDKTIKVAVTGDMPPIDFISESGTPAGFNTAVLSEIGKRLKINIELVNIDAGARAAALASGRVDTVFWFQALKDVTQQADVPENITLSEPYYDWNEVLALVKK